MGLAAIPCAWGSSAAMVPWLIGLKFGWHVTIIGTLPKRYFGGPATLNPLPDCRGKRVRAPKGLLPGEQPEQHNFHIFI